MYGTNNYSGKELNVKSILSKISEYQIFKAYAGDFSANKAFCSPLRKDNKPSFVIGNKSGDWRYKDFATGEGGNCFNFVMAKFNCTFYEALRIIDADFYLGISNSKVIKNEISPDIIIGNIKEIPAVPLKKKIRVTIRDFTEYDVQYWKEQGITLDTLQKFRVFPLKCYWIGSYMFYADKYCYGYWFGNNDWKIYQPYSVDRKWFTNCGNIIQGFDLLPKQHKYLVITKSYKEVMLFYEYKIPAIAPQAESIVISPIEYESIRHRFDIIISNYDWDKAGCHSAWVMRNTLGVEPIMFNDKYDVKDLSEYRKKYGKNSTVELIEKFKEKYEK